MFVRADFRCSQLSGYGSFNVIGKDTLVPIEYPPIGPVERQISSSSFMDGLRPENNRWVAR